MKRKMKKRDWIALIIFVVCIAYLAYSAISNSLASSEEKIINEINGMDMDRQVSEMVLTKETDNGIFCLATTQNGGLIITGLEKDNDLYNRIFESGYKTKYYLATDTIDNFISDNPLKINKVKFVNFDERSCWYVYCTDERAKTLKINGELVQTEKVDIHIDREILEIIPGVTKTKDKRDYSGYFWFCESVDKPTIELAD
ncbi:MAG: hypothetical protein NC122_00975 [Faecalibacterium sp.]|nr:hypothetical protein [Ruminococcus sp.]MCM1391265.1 hypothetical protein [Ruminococcus sp.]MCM1484761.1 hypothetical protein [Faecalibacterium sp.]